MLEYTKITEKTGYAILTQSLTVMHDISDSETVLIDSGYRQSEELLELLRARGKRVAAVLCTHSHVDHIGNNGLLQREHGAKIYMPEREWKVQVRRMETPGEVPFEWMSKDKYFYGDSGRFNLTTFGEDKKSLKIGKTEFRIERLSGHSPEHVGYVTPDSVLGLGDCLMSDVVLKRSKIPYEFNMGKAVDTLRRIREMKYDHFAAAHMAVIPRYEIADVCDANIKFHEDMADEILKKLSDRIEQNKFIMQIIEGRGVHMALTKNSGWLPVAVKSYIDRLIELGMVERTSEGGKDYIKRAGKLADRGI